MFTAPTSDGHGRVITGGDPTRRRFTGWLAQLIRLRDSVCREPYCGAPIRHLDHIQPVSQGGLTEYSNGQGLCEHGNYLRQTPGWKTDVLQYGPGGVPEVIATTTPTGHTYLSRAPNPP